VQPWLPVPPNYTSINVKAEEPEPNSVLDWYQTLIHLKKKVPALAQGSNTMLDTSNTKVLSWLRQTPGAPAVVVSVNFTADAQVVDLSASNTKLPGASLHTLLKTPSAADPTSPSHIELGPFGAYIGELR